MKDQLSAFVDGELDDAACERLLQAVKHSDSLYSEWATYHLIGDVMRDNAVLSAGFEQRVMQAIHDEPTVLAPIHAHLHAAEAQADVPSKYKTSWFLSAAASVAAVFFVGWMVVNNQTSHGTNGVAPMEIAQLSPEQVQSAQIPSEYLLAHQSYAPSGVSSYIQTASYTESAQ